MVARQRVAVHGRVGTVWLSGRTGPIVAVCVLCPN